MTNTVITIKSDITNEIKLRHFYSLLHKLHTEMEKEIKKELPNDVITIKMFELERLD